MQRALRTCLINDQIFSVGFRNPGGFSNQIIIDVAVTGVDGQSRTCDEAVDRPLQVRFDQKIAKYGRIAEQNNLTFIPAVLLYKKQG